MGWVSYAALWQEAKLRILGLAFVGSLALVVPIAAHSASPGSNTGQAMTGPTHSGLVQVGDGHASNWSPAPGGGSGGWHPPHWGPSRFNGGPYGGQEFLTTISGFPEAQSLMIPSRIGAAQRVGGVIRSRWG
jgi:hypothetical protein